MDTGALVIGVVSGIITSVVIFLAVEGFKKVFIPWYQSIIYEGVHIGGTWHRLIDNEQGGTIEAEFTFSQRGHYITGREQTVKIDASKKVIDRKSFTVKGHIHDRLFTTNSLSEDRTRMGSLVLLLQVVSDGRQMIGEACWYDNSSNTIVTHPAVLTRKRETDA